jgi:Mn2+/Fe2+ NRAMP family transporter
MRHRLGLKVGLIALTASVLSTLITCAAEIGGLGLLLRYLTGGSYVLMATISAIVLTAAIWVLPFKWIERTFGLLGLLMVVFVVALTAIDPPWEKVAAGFLPQVPQGLSERELLNFAYFAVAIFSAVMFPYEAYFYSSGGIEEQWGPKDLLTNRVTAIVGMAVGSLLSIAMLAIAAQLFGPADVGPQVPGSVALETAIPLGPLGLILGLLGMLFAVAGAAVETAMANAYSIAQFFGWKWGRRKKPWEAPRFTVAWVVVMAASLAIILTGVDPMSLVQYAIVFSILVLPLTYLPLMLLAGDRKYMGQYANGPLAKVLGWFFFAVITIMAVAALPLYVLTSGGQG